MPIDTPQATRSRTAPSQVARATLRARSSASTNASIKRRLGHRVPTDDAREASSRSSIATSPARRSAGAEMVADHEPGPVVELLAVAGLDVGDALPPPLRLVGLDPDEDAHLRRRRPEAGAERSHQRQPDQPQLDAAHGAHGDGSRARQYVGRPPSRSGSKATTERPAADAGFERSPDRLTPCRAERGSAARTAAWSRGTCTATTSPRAGRPPALGRRGPRPSLRAAEDHPRAVGHRPGGGGRIERPPDDEAVAAVARVDRVGHLSVVVAMEPVAHGSQLVDVQMGVAGDQRVERPAHEMDATIEARRALCELERVPDAAHAAGRGAPRACASARGVRRQRRSRPSRARIRPARRRRTHPTARCRIRRAPGSSPAGSPHPTWPSSPAGSRRRRRGR